MAFTSQYEYQIPARIKQVSVLRTKIMLHVEHVGKIFTLEKERIAALSDVSFDVARGEFFTIIGPSGCGKSTLLRIIAGLEKETSGNLAWEEQPKIGFVFQQYALFPYLTVFENIAF